MPPNGSVSATSPDLEAQYEESRLREFTAVNRHTFWTIAVLLMAFVAWDAYADPVHWRAAARVRALGAAVVVATGLVQLLPGQSRWMPLLARVRLVVAVVAATVAASLLDRGYGFAVAGIVAIILTGPYIAIGRRDLLLTNVAALVALTITVAVLPLPRFDVVGTLVFALLAMAVSMLLGRVIEASRRYAFALERELHRDARTDALTGLDNRRAMEERGALELKRARRTGAPVSIVLGDVDDFKAINDRYGHEAGDAVLRSLAQTLRAALRETDVLGRWGGEEFLVILADTDGPTAADVAERMRAAVAAAALDGIAARITISLGLSTVTEVDAVDNPWDALIKEADERLYRAKSEGRDRVIGSPAPRPTW